MYHTRVYLLKRKVTRLFPKKCHLLYLGKNKICSTMRIRIITNSPVRHRHTVVQDESNSEWYGYLPFWSIIRHPSVH